MQTVVPGLALAFGLAGAASSQTPSFDCANAASDTEKLICRTPELAQLDTEQARLFALAEGAYIKAATRNTLVATQRGWVKARDDCRKAEDPVRCVRDSTVTRIAALIRDYPATRDGGGISLGPFDARCYGLGAEMVAVFVDSDPGAVSLTWGDRSVVLDHVMSGSGARYEATLDDGHYLFWNKGDAATFEVPGVIGTLDCTLTEAG